MGVRSAIGRRVLLLRAGAVGAALGAACTPGMPADLDDLCRIFEERPRWERGTRESHRRWGLAPPIQLAFVHQESRFRAEARPPRHRLLGVIPLGRASSAYGYGQAGDGVWGEYRDETGRPRARRDRFEDVADFIGWYGDRVHRWLGVGKADAYHLYLAYHEGPTGFRRGSYEEKPWLVGVARRVAERAERYAAQQRACPPSG